MKYYITSSSLNIDNILSSESISPYSFYEKRDFGYRTFQKIKEISLVNDILLFSELPYFEIQDSERENYPMVLEIEDDKQLNEKVHKLDAPGKELNAFMCNETIYLNPWNCKIYFFSQQAITLAKLKCEDSLCNKLGHLFRLELISSNKLVRLPEILQKMSFQESPFNLEKFVIDSKINKIKGFLYTYYLGVTKSLSKDTAQLLRIQKRIYNIVASIINNKGISNDRFNEELKALDNQYNDIDPHKKNLRQIWNEKILSHFSTTEDKTTFESILKELSVENEAKMNFCKTNNILVRKMTFSISNKYFDWTEYQNELNAYTQSIIYEDKLNRQDVDLKDAVLLKNNYQGISLTSNQSDLYNKLITKFFFEEVTTIEDLRLKRFEIATQFTKAVKNIFESENKNWDNSIERIYLNSLRQNIANSEQFDLQQVPDIIILSIAAFILKGDDFEALLRYLEENGVSDYYYVLGFWGAACGYIDIPKTILKPIIRNKQNFTNIYKSIHFILHNETLIGEIPEPIIKRNTFTPTYNDKIQNNKIQENTIDKKVLFDAVEFVRNDLGKFSKSQNTVIGEVIAKASSENGFLSLLLKNKGCGKTSKIYKSFASYFEQGKTSSENTLFSSNNNVNLIDELSCFKGVNKDISERLKDNWNYVRSQNNATKSDEIKFFINLCKKEGAGRAKKKSPLLNFFTDDIANKCFVELIEKYGK